MQELEREREEKAALAAEAERTRIARELHDVLTHSVSVMVIQAQAAQAAAGDARPQVAGALTRIETVGKESLVELRRLLQRLRDGRRHAAARTDRRPRPARRAARRGARRGTRRLARTRWRRRASTTSERRSLGVPDRAGGADEHAAPRGHAWPPRSCCATGPDELHARGARRRPARSPPARPGGAWSGGDARTGRARGRHAGRRGPARGGFLVAARCPCRQGRDAAGRSSPTTRSSCETASA